MISGWVQKVTEHRGTIQYPLLNIDRFWLCIIFSRQGVPKTAEISYDFFFLMGRCSSLDLHAVFQFKIV